MQYLDVHRPRAVIQPLFDIFQQYRTRLCTNSRLSGTHEPHRASSGLSRPVVGKGTGAGLRYPSHGHRAVSPAAFVKVFLRWPCPKARSLHSFKRFNRQRRTHAHRCRRFPALYKLLRVDGDESAWTRPAAADRTIWGTERGEKPVTVIEKCSRFDNFYESY